MGCRRVTNIKLAYIHRFKDRHGKVRFYFRRGTQRTAIPGVPGSREFMTAYQAALEGSPPPPVSKAAPGSMAALAASWYRSADFANLMPATKTVYRRVADALVTKHGDKPIAPMEARHVRELMDAKAATPAAANRLLSILHLMMRHAVERNMRRDDPTVGVRRLRYRKQGYATWTEEHITAFEARWASGTRARRALALLLYTGQRRSDVIRMGRQHLRNGMIEVRQQKTDKPLMIPVHPELQREIDAAPAGQMIFLMTELGKPFASGNAFYNWFIDCCRAAGIPPGFSPHGLRKAISRRLAEGGCTPHMIQAITGHVTLAEVERYTRAADQERLARGAVAHMGGKPAG